MILSRNILYLCFQLLSMLYLYSQNHQRSCVLLHFVCISCFLAHRVVSCLGNLISNFPKDNSTGVSFT